MREKYTPSQEEIAKAESMMTEEERELSEIRSRFHFQERDAFDDFLEHIDMQGERREATEEEKRQMDENMASLWKALGDSGVEWHIDGALNISAYQGEYIGIHKDVDISVEEPDMQRLEDVLQERGYGFFLSQTKEGDADTDEKDAKRIMERVGTERFLEASVDHRLIGAIDDEGKIREGQSLNFMDIHVVQRNENGEPLGPGGVPLPDKWFKSRTIDFRGNKTNVSHPGKVAFYKLHETRNYDQTDLEKLVRAGVLTDEDLAEVGQMIDREFEISTQKARELLAQILENVEPGMDSEEIYHAFMENPVVKSRVTDTEKGRFEKLAQAMADGGAYDVEAVLFLALEMLGNNAYRREVRSRFEEVRRIQESS